MTANMSNHADHWSTSITSSKDFLPLFPTIHQTDRGPQQSSLRLALLLSAMQSAFQWLFSCADARPGKGRSGAWVCAIQDYNTVVNQPSKSVSEFTSFKGLHEIFLNPESRSRDPVDYAYLYKYSKLWASILYMTARLYDIWYMYFHDFIHDPHDKTVVVVVTSGLDPFETWGLELHEARPAVMADDSLGGLSHRAENHRGTADLMIGTHATTLGISQIHWPSSRNKIFRPLTLPWRGCGKECPIRTLLSSWMLMGFCMPLSQQISFVVRSGSRR